MEIERLASDLVLSQVARVRKAVLLGQPACDLAGLDALTLVQAFADLRIERLGGHADLSKDLSA